MKATFTVTGDGPIVDGTAADRVDDVVPRVVEEVADHGVNLIRHRLKEVLKHPTGYYESRIQTDRAAESMVITDGRVVYGPWLEGVSSRNKRSRFKGYATFRRTAKELDHDAERIAEPYIADAVGDT